jgi:hypothetical protein
MIQVACGWCGSVRQRHASHDNFLQSALPAVLASLEHYRGDPSRASGVRKTLSRRQTFALSHVARKSRSQSVLLRFALHPHAVIPGPAENVNPESRRTIRRCFFWIPDSPTQASVRSLRELGCGRRPGMTTSADLRAASPVCTTRNHAGVASVAIGILHSIGAET